MLKTSNINKEFYFEIMELLKKTNAESAALILMPIATKRPLVQRIINYVQRNISNRHKLRLLSKEMNRYSGIKSTFPNYSSYQKTRAENYFTESRIAIYTSVFGRYDQIFEPQYVPNNCDFYIVTDQEIDPHSKWKKVSLDSFNETIQHMSHIEKNRFFKIKPHLIFPEYDYSIYIDGNVQVICDLTHLISKIGAAGIAVHKHRERNCVYEEAKEVLLLNRDTTENVMKHVKHLLETEMPKHFGLFECGVIVRDHRNETCTQLMNRWWDEFSNFSNRDQLSFAHSLYINRISVSDVGVLGDNVYKNPSFRFYRHG